MAIPDLRKRRHKSTPPPRRTRRRQKRPSSEPPEVLRTEPIDPPSEPPAAAEAAAEGSTAIVRRPSSSAPPPARRTRSSAPPRDPRSEGGGVYAERVLAKIDARESAIPEPLPPDRRQRILSTVTELARSGPESDAPLRKQLMKFGEDALPSVAHAFPGSLWVDLARPHRPLRSARHLSGLANALVGYGEAAIPYVASLLRASRPETRLSAALVAADLMHGELVKPLAARLQDEVPLVRRAACVALRACAPLPEAQNLRAELILTLENTKLKPQWRKKAAWMIGQLRDAESVPRLIELLGDPDVSDTCRETLVFLIGKDVGRFRFRWRSWWKAHGDEPRERWLIEALDQPDQARRAMIAEELVLLTGEGFERRHAIATREQAKELGEHYRRWLTEQRR